MTPAGSTVRLNRRTLFRGAGSAAAIGVLTANRAGAQTATALPAAQPPSKVAALPTRYGTPTDLARTSVQTAWTRDHDGTVLRYDQTRHIWRPDPRQWAVILGFGTAVLARWGRPSGANALVMVFGTAPASAGKPPRTVPPPPPVASKPSLAATGFDAQHLTVAGASTLVIGALLLARSRRMAALKRR